MDLWWFMPNLDTPTLVNLLVLYIRHKKVGDVRGWGCERWHLVYSEMIHETIQGTFPTADSVSGQSKVKSDPLHSAISSVIQRCFFQSPDIFVLRKQLQCLFISFQFSCLQWNFGALADLFFAYGIFDRPLHGFHKFGFLSTSLAVLRLRLPFPLRPAIRVHDPGRPSIKCWYPSGDSDKLMSLWYT